MFRVAVVTRLSALFDRNFDSGDVVVADTVIAPALLHGLNAPFRVGCADAQRMSPRQCRPFEGPTKPSVRADRLIELSILPILASIDAYLYSYDCTTSCPGTASQHNRSGVD